MTYYQLMSGDQARDFSQVMYDFGVAIVGPGRFGSLDTSLESYPEKELNKVDWLKKVVPGDRIVLKSGRSLIQAIGEVKSINNSIYHYLNCFEDVDGWDLQHACYVNWKKINHTLSNVLLDRSTVSRLRQQPVIDIVDRLWVAQDFLVPRFQPNIQDEPLFTYDTLEEALINMGMRVDDAENTVRTISKVEKLANWYNNENHITSEHEIRAFLVIPLLYALGWSYQKMAVEYNHIDIALFPTIDRKMPKIIVEN